MANVHTLGDLNDDSRGMGGGNRMGYNPMAGAPVQELDPEGQAALDMFSGVMGGSAKQTKRPREENFFDMWRFTFCGNWSRVAWPNIVCLIITVVYILELVLTALSGEELNKWVFLGPPLSILDTMGAKNPYKEKENWQMWRLVTPLFLSLGFNQWLQNSVTILIIGFITESSKIGFMKMALLFIVTGSGGYLMGSVCSDNAAVSLSPSIFGYVAAMIACVIVNWKALEPIGMMRMCIIFILVLLFVFLMLFSTQSVTGNNTFDSSDMYANFGGFLTGLCLGMMLMRPTRLQGRMQPTSYEQKIFKIGLLLLLIYFALFFTLFYTVVNPTELKY